jgi:hypothetical protein
MPESQTDITERMRDGREIDAAMGNAVRQALLRHKLLGNPVCTWQDGQVVWVQPEDIPVDIPADHWISRQRRDPEGG